jgi:hypothetical protein
MDDGSITTVLSSHPHISSLNAPRDEEAVQQHRHHLLAFMYQYKKRWKQWSTAMKSVSTTTKM